jgi:transposase InsO family protein
VYKWLKRHEAEGWEGLEERSRAAHHHPNQLGAQIEEEILKLKRRWPDWGAPKIRQKLKKAMGAKGCPAESTVGEILKKHGLVKKRRIRRRAVPGGEPLKHCLKSNAVWCVDFKGWWKTLDGRRCEPLTVSDGWSRYLLRCVGVAGTGQEIVQPHFEMLFREHGLPEAIRTDNGPPFATTGLGGLSGLSVWWLRLGLRLERIEPGCPQQNGRHERMHLSLEQSRAREARANLAQQQKALDVFRREYNEERPHESLDQKVPAEVYEPSERIYEGRLNPPREYPTDWETRAVRGCGQMKWRMKDVRVTQALVGERVGLEPRGDGLWAVWFETLELGLLDERRGRIQGHKRLPKSNSAPSNP